MLFEQGNPFTTLSQSWVLPYIKIGRAVRYRTSDVERALSTLVDEDVIDPWHVSGQNMTVFRRLNQA